MSAVAVEAEEEFLPLLHPDEVPELEGWVLFSDACSILGMTKQGLHGRLFVKRTDSAEKRLRRQRPLKTVCVIGRTVAPVYVLRLDEVEAYRARRRAGGV